jgi:formylglycine-generating enzyme required for sulfatase activity
VGRDGVYIAYANGIVKDTKTGLEWMAGPDRDVSWDEARAWVESLNAGGGGWRMPTMKELKGLYHYGKGSRNMTPLLKTTGYYVWSSQSSGRDFSAFDFSSGFDLGNSV